jgi:hypothetical protein
LQLTTLFDLSTCMHVQEMLGVLRVSVGVVSQKHFNSFSRVLAGNTTFKCIEFACGGIAETLKHSPLVLWPYACRNRIFT